MKTLFLILFAVAGSALAQTAAPSSPLAPELAPLAAKHKADLAAVDQQRAAALSRSLRFYLNALDTEDKAALQRSDLGGVAAIHKERDAVKAGLIGDLITAPFPEKLPASLKTSRAALFDSFKRIEADVLKLRQQVDANYVRALTALGQSAAGKPELAQQIKAESDAVLGNPVTKPEGEVEVAAKKGKLLNGDFTEGDANGFPVGWKLLNGGLENSPPPGETYKVVHENGRSFLHTAFEQPSKEFQLTQVVEAPPFAKEAEFKIQYRGSLKGKFRVKVNVVNEKKPEENMPGGFTLGENPAATWKTLGRAMKLDGKTKTQRVRIEIETLRSATGFMDYAHVELNFK